MRFYEKRFAEEYERRLTLEGYPGNLLNIVADELKGLKTIIDVGAGSGFFSIPLAQMGYFITAVEPSSEMLGIAQNKIKGQSFSSNVTLCQNKWEEWRGDKADGLISIYSIYAFKDFVIAIDKMIQYALKRVILVRNSDKTSDTISEHIRRHFKINTKARSGSIDIGVALKKINIDYILKDVVQERIIRFKDLDSEAEYYAYQFKLKGSDIDEIKKILIDITTKKDETYTFTLKYNDLMFVF